MPRFIRAPGAGLSFPNALNTGPAAGGFSSLTPQPSTNIPATAPYPSFVTVQGDGSLLVQGCSFTATLPCDASNITFRGCSFTTAGSYAVQPGPDAAGPWTFSYCQASAPDATPGNSLLFGFVLPDGLSTSQRSVVDRCNLFWFAGQPVTGINHVMISNSWLHDTVTVAGKHCEMVYLGTQGGGGTNTDATVTGCALLPGPSTNNTAACYMDAHGNNYDSYTITNNLLAGGDYTLYLGAFAAHTDTNLTVTGNWFSTADYSGGGQFGYANSPPSWGVSGNTWANNKWYDGASAGQLLAAP